MLGLMGLPAAAEKGTYSCETLLGEPAGFDLTWYVGPPLAVGACTLVHTSVDTEVTAITTGTGCTIQSEADGVVGYTPVAVGTIVAGKSTIWSVCSTGTLRQTSTIQLTDGLSIPAPPRWTAPVTVGEDNTASGNRVAEPHITGDSQGRLYFAPTGPLFRSEDGGVSWKDISPRMPDALPALQGNTDTSVSVTPDGTVWYARNWAELAGTVVCRSVTHGDVWSCDNLASPGVTDRMWVLGTSATEAYVQNMQGYVVQPQWMHTTSGGPPYVPYATTLDTEVMNGVNGNMARELGTDAIWQPFLDLTTGLVSIDRVDTTQGPLITGTVSGVPYSYSAPSMAVADHVMWLPGEAIQPDGSRTISANRSRDHGTTWERLILPSPARSVKFSTVTAAGGGHVAIVFYGSDTVGVPEANGGLWSLYIAETRNGLAKHPAWRVTRLVDVVHAGSMCAGLTCENKGSDPFARYAGDFMGSWIDSHQVVHVAYESDYPDHQPRANYVRQLASTRAR